jgi:hypothetical protein
MKTVYDNQQDEDDPLNGSVIETDAELTELLERVRTRKPFFIRLSCDNGFELMIGISGNVGCVQHSRSRGESPNLLAVSAHPPIKRGYVEFLTANTPTPVAARYIIDFDELKQVAAHFLRTGERTDKVVWQKFYPRALGEDAERTPDS